MFLGSLSSGGHFSGVSNLAKTQHIVIGPGDSGIYQTVALIKKKAREGTQQPEVRRIVQGVLGGLPPGANQHDKARALVQWFSSNIRYEHDDYLSFTEEGLKHVHIKDCPKSFRICEPVEIVSDAPQILKQGFGDCDDHVLLMGALLWVAGIEWCPVIVALDADMPSEFSHIYLLAKLDGEMVPIDTVNRSQPFGWEAGGAFRKQSLC